MCPPCAAALQHPRDGALTLALSITGVAAQSLGALTEAIRSACTEMKASLLQAAERAGLLGLVRPASVLPDAIRLDRETIVASEDEAFRTLALKWPGEDAGEAGLVRREGRQRREAGCRALAALASPPPELRGEVALQAPIRVTYCHGSLCAFVVSSNGVDPAGAGTASSRYLDTPGALKPFVTGPFHDDSAGAGLHTVKDARWLRSPRDTSPITCSSTRRCPRTRTIASKSG